MVVLGIDAHKRSHTAVAVDEAGRRRGERTTGTTSKDHLELLSWAEGFGGERLWAVEDCRHLSRRLERDLLVAGERIVRVPPKLMAHARDAARSYGKSDPIDALAVARAALREPDLPMAHLDGSAREVRLLVDHRDKPRGRAHSGDRPAALAPPCARSFLGAARPVPVAAEAPGRDPRALGRHRMHRRSAGTGLGRAVSTVLRRDHRPRQGTHRPRPSHLPRSGRVSAGAPGGGRTYTRRILRTQDIGHCGLYLRLCPLCVSYQPHRRAAVDVISCHEPCHAGRPAAQRTVVICGALIMWAKRLRVASGCSAC
jgi:hypothetical protein